MARLPQLVRDQHPAHLVPREKPTGITRTGQLQQTPVAEWSSSIAAGVPTIADSEVALFAGALQGLLSIPTDVATPLVDRSFAGVWAGPMLPDGGLVNGTPRLHVTVAPSARDTSVFACLYDVDALGIGSLISHKPMTLCAATPGQSVALDILLEATSWQVRAGHRLVLVVDTVDPRYLGRSSAGSSVRFDSDRKDPARLAVPLA